MQISPTIMRLAVILSVSLQIYANTVVVPPAAWVTASGPAPPPGVGSPALPAASPVRLLLPARPAAASRSERNVYRTKLSKLRLILLADMLNELELITCLANSSTLNVTTKHCDCETYSCKDLLASSSPSPLNYIQPKRKVHSSCREHCCRKKKFNRSIDPATLGNVLVTSDGDGRRRNTGSEASLIHPSAGRLVQLSSRTGVVSGGEPSRRGVTVTVGPPSPRDRLAAYCNRDAIAQISISNGDQRTIIPWLYRVGLIETRHPVCVGALIHPSVILTTAVCVINKKPEELYVWNGGADGPVDQHAVSRIMLPDQFATTFERLENNVALLVLVRGAKQDKHVGSPSGVRESLPPPPEVEPSAAEWRRRNRWHEGTEPMGAGRPRKRTPGAVPICLSSIIDSTTQDRRAHRASGRCFTVAHRRTDRLGRSTLLRHQPKTPDTSVATDGTNYVTTNISIFPATECRPEHRDYLQHDGNLCAGYDGAARNRSIDVDYSGAPLICDEENGGRTWRTVRGLLTWSTDINHAPHLFTNLTTYRPWIERTIEQLELPAQRSSGGPPIAAQTTRRTYRPGVVLYG